MGDSLTMSPGCTWPSGNAAPLLAANDTVDLSVPGLLLAGVGDSAGTAVNGQCSVHSETKGHKHVVLQGFPASPLPVTANICCSTKARYVPELCHSE